LNLFRNRGGFVTTEGVLGEIGATVAYYVSMRSGIKRAISNNRRTRRENRRSGIRSSPSSLREVLRDNKYYLKTHRSLSRFLSSETEGNFPEVSSGMFPTFYKEIDKVLTERDFLYPYDSLCGLLEEQAGRDFPEEWDSEFSSICEIWLSVCGNDPLSKLSSVDKGLVVAAIYGGDGCGLFSADGSMISAYHRAVRDFALSDCFVCDAVNRRVDWLK